MIVPKRIVTPLCLDVGGIDSDIVVGSAHYHFLTPVSEQVTLIARRTLGIVVCQTAFKSRDSSSPCLIYRSGSIFPIGIVECFRAQVTVPIYTEILGDVVFGTS